MDSRGCQNGLLNPSGGALGRQVGPQVAAKAALRPLGALLGLPGGCRRAPRRLREDILGGFSGDRSREASKSRLLVDVYCLFFLLWRCFRPCLAFLAARPAAKRTSKIDEHPLVFTASC